MPGVKKAISRQSRGPKAPRKQYKLFVVGGRVVTQTIDEVKYGEDGRLLPPPNPR